MKEPFLCFIHIERAGGTTLHFIIQHSYPTYMILRPWFNWSNKPGCYVTVKELQCLMKFFPFTKGIGGHTTRVFLDYEKVIDKPFFYFTFLRDPISRYISHFHLRRVMKENQHIQTFIRDERFNNYQTVRIAGEENIEKAIGFLEGNFHFIGLTDKFDESLILLKDRLGDKKFCINYERLNVSKKHYETDVFEDLSTDIQHKIVENNKLDLILYDYAVNHIYAKFKKDYSGNLSSDLKTFQESNEKYRFPTFKNFSLKAYQIFLQYAVQPLPHRIFIKKNQDDSKEKSI